MKRNPYEGLIEGGIGWDIEATGPKPSRADSQYEKKKALGALRVYTGKWFKHLRKVKWTYDGIVMYDWDDERGFEGVPHFQWSLSFLGPRKLVEQIIKRFGGSYEGKRLASKRSAFVNPRAKKIERKFWDPKNKGWFIIVAPDIWTAISFARSKGLDDRAYRLTKKDRAARTKFLTRGATKNPYTWSDAAGLVGAVLKLYA